MNNLCLEDCNLPSIKNIFHSQSSLPASTLKLFNADEKKCERIQIKICTLTKTQKTYI